MFAQNPQSVDKLQMAVENFVKFPSMCAIATFKWIRRMDIKLTQRVAAEFFDFLCKENNFHAISLRQS
jgi:hypothetical protein